MKNKGLLCLVFTFCIQFIFSQDLNLSIQTIPDSLTKNANSVIRFDETNIELVSQRKMIVKVRKAVTVLNQRGDENKYVIIGYDKSRKIKNKKTRIYDAVGSIIKEVKKKDYRDISQVDGGTLYSDNRMLFYEYIPIKYPYTIYSEYEIESSNTAFIPVWHPIKSYDTSILSSTVSLTYDSAQLTVQTKEDNFGEYIIFESKDKNIITYEVSNIKPITVEPLSPTLKENSPKVQFISNQFYLEGIAGVAANWKELGKWEYDNLYKDVGDLSDETKQKINMLVNGIEDPIEKAKVVYEYVQAKTRYISVQVGIGGLKPMLAKDVDRLGYGDCKALTNYTKSLLNEVGVESYFTELYGSNEKLNMDFNSPNVQGNHVILNIPTATEDIWLECTNQKVPFGYIANFTDDRDVIVIKPEGGVIKHTKVYHTKDNLQLTNGNYHIDDKGTMKATLTIKSSGAQYNDNLQLYDGQNKKDLDILFKNYLSNINNIEFSKIETVNDKNKSLFKENLEFKATNYTSTSGDQVLFTINAFNKTSYIPKRVKNRKLPFQFSRGYTDIDEVLITISENFKVASIPEKIDITTKFGSYTAEILENEDGSYIYKRKLILEEGRYPKEDYSDYRNFRKQITKYDKTKLLLLKN